LKDVVGLPNFDQPNWPSRLRHYGEEYEQMFENEISDIQYNDTKGAFTAFLQRQFESADHTPAPTWLSKIFARGPWPLYYIEVKGTPSDDHETPFFVSGKQYETVSVRKHALILHVPGTVCGGICYT
jgi:hypothetical protein